MHVGRFLVWMKSASAERRVEAIEALARAYLYSDLDEADREAMEAAMTVILDDSGPDVRAALAEALAPSPDAPRHIILTLVTDLPEIAALVLERSPVLIDVELVDLVAGSQPTLQAAIAARQPMSRMVAAAVAEVGDALACQALLANPTAVLTRATLRRIAERYGERAHIREMLLEMPDLPVDIHQMLIRQLSQVLGAYTTNQGWIGREQAEAAAREACDRATVMLAAESDGNGIAALVEHLRASGQLTAVLMLRALCAGNVPFFEAALADLSGVPVSRVASLVRDGRMAALRSVYSRAGLPQLAFDAFAAALETCREIVRAGGSTEGYRFARMMVDRILARYRAISNGEMDELIGMVRRFAADAARSAARDYVDARIEAA